MTCKITSRLSNYLHCYVMPALSKIDIDRSVTECQKHKKDIPRHSWDFGSIVHVFFRFVEVEKIGFTGVAVVLSFKRTPQIFSITQYVTPEYIPGHIFALSVSAVSSIITCCGVSHLSATTTISAIYFSDSLGQKSTHRPKHKSNPPMKAIV